ncbi:MAG TPA: PTS mannose/fructose/sorbose transporter subunit IIB [Caldithrix abyssi]|uniref:PTS mannose/fructose/sorbose transporter subunit IIB n=1 Tax=Caldithrix abyssi TaxID=187145 RepID=A0A7V5H406_CALAY|nr:PTS sugar transporter subunit IIB [Caldisericaceae bacterium]HHE55449.1 PTS mannose/fructose/sorbose transporter subunit IIB [Caldithrix abyssi]
MKVQLFRIDDRLIHGQVVIGWANFINSEKVVLCDDSVAENDWEKELYLSSVPEYLTAIVLSTDQMAEILKNETSDLSKTIVLVNSPFTVEKLVEKDSKPEEINVGGIHYKEGRREYLPYLFLNDLEVALFKKLMAQGIQFYCQDVPSAKRIPLQKVLSK